MATSQFALVPQPSLLSQLAEARMRTDALFDLLPPNSFYERPIPERHRMIFYLGHLEAFDWNLLSDRLGLKPQDKKFDDLFAFGIDPVGGGLPTDVPSDWPTISEVEKYKRRVRTRLDDQLNQVHERRLSELHEGSGDDSPADLETLLHVAIEHRQMHAETIAYLLHNLPVEKKTPHRPPVADPARAPRQRMVTIPEGVATIGLTKGLAATFGWDNEFEAQQISVPAFSIHVYPVTNAEYLRFVRAGGYQTQSYWKPEDWEWKSQHRLEHPHFWVARSSSRASDPDTQWEYRGMFGTIPLPPSWPVYVSHAEASAFARWAGKKLPTEAQWHRAAYGTPSGTEQPYPWGGAAPDSRRGNFHHEHWDPTGVEAHPEGVSAFGIFDLLGNGWEWTSTVFEPLPGFEPFSFYPGYSANFFDGKHFVMKGGSPRTDACMLRQSFRNWFQPHYPHVYATFRCVED
jgi:gamma-glutamyl hercynylcysteine S-oxide synthase